MQLAKVRGDWVISSETRTNLITMKEKETEQDIVLFVHFFAF